MLKVGFEQGGAVSRQEKRGERFVEVLYEVYAPRVIAGIAGLKDNLEDRILALVMVRRRKDEPIARLNRETEAEAQRLRDACALACLGRIGDVLAAYELAPGSWTSHRWTIARSISGRRSWPSPWWPMPKPEGTGPSAS